MDVASVGIRISYVIILLVLVTLVFVSYAKVTDNEMVYVQSDVDSEYYLVRNTKDKRRAANLLASIKSDIMDVSEYMSLKLKSTNKEDITRYGPYKEYIEQLERNLRSVVIRESDFNTVYTSYTVNKGESIVFCIRSKSISNLLNKSTIHDKNLVMYVALHEISHVACPEVGHTPLFKKIFKFICEVGMEIGIYRKIDFDSSPEMYCGMMITDSIV